MYFFPPLFPKKKEVEVEKEATYATRLRVQKPVAAYSSISHLKANCIYTNLEIQPLAGNLKGPGECKNSLKSVLRTSWPATSSPCSATLFSWKHPVKLVGLWMSMISTLCMQPVSKVKSWHSAASGGWAQRTGAWIYYVLPWSEGLK